MARMLLIDGSNHAFRVQFALPPRHATDGFPTRVLYGFLLLFQKMLRTYRPDYVCVSFDTGGNFREELYPDYKGHRPETPADLKQQWPFLGPLVEAFGYKVIMTEGYEADDVLGTLAKRFGGPDCEVFLVTGDKDFCQLVDDHIRILDEAKNLTIDHDGVVEKFGVPPNQVIDVLGLMGDASDNVPGVSKVGPKTATKLVQDFGSLEGALEAAAKGLVKGKTGENLVTDAEIARLSKRLVTIALDVPLDVTLEDLRPQPLHEAELRAMFDRWEFGAAARKLLPDTTEPEAAERVDLTPQAALEAWAKGTVRAVLPVWEADELAGVALANEEGAAAYVPLDDLMVRGTVLSLFGRADVPKVGYGVQADVRRLQAHHVAVAGVAGDVRLLDQLLASHRRSHDLGEQAVRHLGTALRTTEDPIADAIERVSAIGRLEARLLPRLEDGLRHVYDTIELPLVPVLARMEAAGIRLDTERIGAVETEIVARLGEVEASCHEAAGKVFNLRSRHELRDVLFDDLKLPAGKKLKDGFSTAADVLEKLADLHPLPGLVLEYRELDKLRGTYLSKLPEYVAADGRIHTTLHAIGAATGRLSSADPNLQNIPIRTREGRRIRGCFVPDAGHVFLSADYSQIELRILAHVTQDEVLIDGFARGEDIHKRTAVQVFGADPDAVTVAERSAAKAINFGLLYGMSAFRLGSDLQISREQAQRWMDAYFESMPRVRAWIEATKESCREKGYVDTIYGRRRLLPEIHSSQFVERAAAEREAVNTVIQGTAADIVKLAMIDVDGALRDGGLSARMVLQVHDELLLEVPVSEVDAVRSLVAARMSGAASLAVPLEVQTAVGRSWDEAHG